MKFIKRGSSLEIIVFPELYSFIIKVVSSIQKPNRLELRGTFHSAMMETFNDFEVLMFFWKRNGWLIAPK